MRSLMLGALVFALQGLQAEEPVRRNKGEVSEYFSVGLADGQGQTTAVHAFNPSATESLQLTLSAFHGDGSLQVVLPENSGALSPALVSQVTVELPPLGTYAMETQNVGPGRDIGSLEVVATGEVALWQRKQSREVGIHRDMQTQRFVRSEEIAAEYTFPIAMVGSTDQLPEAAALGLGAAVVETSVMVKNTTSLTAAVRVHGRDALVGQPLGSYQIELEPQETKAVPLGQMFPNALTGNLTLKAELVNGQAFPFVGFRRGLENLDYLGLAGEAKPEGTQALQMPFHHHGFQDLGGFMVVTKDGKQSSFTGAATLTLAPDQQVVTQNVSVGAGQAAFLATAAFLDAPEKRNLGWMEVSSPNGPLHAMTLVSANETRGIVLPVEPLGRRATFPLNGAWPWEIALAESHLMVHLEASDPTNITALFMDGESNLVKLSKLTLEPGANAFPVLELVQDAEEVRTVLLEMDEPASGPVYADLFLFGDDPGLVRGTMLDVVPVQTVSGHPLVSRLADIYEAWESDLPSCLGSQLNVMDVVGFINQPTVCP